MHCYFFSNSNTDGSHFFIRTLDIHPDTAAAANAQAELAKVQDNLEHVEVERCGVLGEIVDVWLFGRGLADLDRFAANVRAVSGGRPSALAIG